MPTNDPKTAPPPSSASAMVPSRPASCSGGTAFSRVRSSFCASCRRMVGSEVSAGICASSEIRSVLGFAGGTNSTELTPKRFDGTVRAVTLAGMPSA